MIKQLPNFLTLCNLFCGCLAITYILFSAPYLMPHGDQEQEYWIIGSSSFYWGAIFIFAAGIFDVLDGLVARILGVESPLGADLDSLADVVSFGVAPSCILFKLLWAAHMKSPHAMDISILQASPAFILACFGALRLARFNNAPKNNAVFTGTPIPSVGIAVAGLGLAVYHQPFTVGNALQNVWLLYGIILVGSYLMVSKIECFTIKLDKLASASNWGRYLWLALSIVAIVIFKYLGIPIAFLLYVIISLFYKPQAKLAN
jgi:CDP-diacylglycerol---serine O-phosphatidyltransferase